MDKRSTTQRDDGLSYDQSNVGRPKPISTQRNFECSPRKYAQQYPQCVEELSKGTYVDDINIGGDTVKETKVLKEQAKEILGEGSFMLHKWHSNAVELERVTSWNRANLLMPKKR